MKRQLTLLLTALTLVACSENENPGLLDEISGTWKVERTNYRICEDNDCSDNMVEAGFVDLSFVVKSDSVILQRFIESPEVKEKFKIETVIGDTLKLRNATGVWDFVIADREADRMTVTGVVTVPDNENLIYYDIVYLIR